MFKEGILLLNPEAKEREPIIRSLLWTDLYKLTMGQAVFDRYPQIRAEYEFINRGRHEFPPGFADKLREQIDMMADLSLTSDERAFLEEKCPYFTKDYLDWLSLYHFDPNEVQIEQQGGELNLTIKGPWERTIYWEVPLMALICQLYYQETGQYPEQNYTEKVRQKAQLMKDHGALLLEFGTRRAFSREVHTRVLETLIGVGQRTSEGGILLGTSNVYLARKYNLNPSGTYAHEWVMAHAAMFGYPLANQKAMENWAKEYLGMDGGPAYPNLGTALMDTYTTEAFLKTLTVEILQYYTFLRQDSGNPIEKGEKTVQRLRELGINPLTKGIPFTDGLNIPKAIEIQNYFKEIISRVFGIGTDLTNDVGVQPMNIVIKVHSFTLPDGRKVPVCKLSDDRGKESGDPRAIAEAKSCFGLK